MPAGLWRFGRTGLLDPPARCRRSQAGSEMRDTRNNPWRIERGVTLVELMVTLGIMSILLSMALPMYRNAIIGAKEAALREQLRTLRQFIDEYTIDKQKAPQSLEDLVTGGYLKELPTDPFTGSNGTWKADMEDAVWSADQTESGIVDVHSGSDRTALDGSACFRECRANAVSDARQPIAADFVRYRYFFRSEVHVARRSHDAGCSRAFRPA